MIYGIDRDLVLWVFKYFFVVEVSERIPAAGRLAPKPDILPDLEAPVC